MSAKLLYSLSDDNKNLQRQIGCMNGFLHFFDRRNFVSSRSINRRLPPGEDSGKQKDGNATGKRSKEKHHKIAKEVQRNAVEPARTSFSSSTGSTTMSSSLEYDSTIKSEQSPFHETTSTETNSWDLKVNQFPYSPYRSNSSPIGTPKRGPMTNQMDSPRFLHPSKLDSPRLTSLNESFRSTSSNQSAPVTPVRKKDASRMSYDGTETREKFVTSLKFGDLPRLSLDSRQRNVNKSVSESRKDLLLTDLQKDRQHSSNLLNQPEEPGSFRPPSNIVVKLMGLEALPDYTPTHKNRIELDGFSFYGGRLDSLSRSSRTIDESKVNRVLDSPRNNSNESRTPRLSKEPSIRVSSKPPPRKNQDGYPDCGKTAAKCREVQPKSLNHSLTLYGEIERNWADLDFKKSGKDLRALKQILEAIHREKSMKEAGKENHSSSGCLSEISINNNTGKTKGSPKANQQHVNRTCQLPHRHEVPRHPQDIKSTRNIKPPKLVRDSAKAAASNIQHVPLPRPQQLRFNQPGANVLDSVDEKATKIYCSPELASQAQSIKGRDFRARTPRPIRTSKATEHVIKDNFTSLVKISETVSTKMYRRNRLAENHSHTPVTTMISRTKHNQQAMGPRPQNQKPQTKSSILQDCNGHSSKLSTDSACLSQQRNPIFLLPGSNNGLVCQADSKSPERIRGEESLAELPIDMKEQPSPISVLDAKFYGDECVSPVKKKPTAFTADHDTTSTTTEKEGKDIDINDSPYSMRQSFICDSDHQRQEKFKQSGQTPRQLNTYQGGNVTSTTPHKDINLETEYVRDILLASGFLDDHNFIEVNHSVYQCKRSLNPNLFFVLEQTRGNRFLSDYDTVANTMKTMYDKHRRLIFDVVNELLSNKLPSKGTEHQPKLFLNSLSGFKKGQHLLLEILKEVERLQANNDRQSVDDEDNFLTSIIENDLMHGSANWINANSEIAGLVLDIERLIFKDLIVELVHDEAPHLQAQKHGHCSNLPH